MGTTPGHSPPNPVENWKNFLGGFTIDAIMTYAHSKEWEVNPHDSAIHDEQGLRFTHRTGRVEIVISPLSKHPSDPNSDVFYPVNVYESRTFDNENDEFIDHNLVASLTNDDAGSKYASTFLEANTLAVNAILEIHDNETWIDVSLDEPTDSEAFHQV